MNSNNPRITEIDGLRGLAILMVISFHYVNNQLVGANSLFAKMLYFSTSFGWAGVDLFFVLSGFLIGSILLRSDLSWMSIRTFFIRRFLRIIPNYYLILLVFGVVFKLEVFKNSTFLSGNQSIPFWSYFAMVHNFYMASLEQMGNPALSVTWSIGIEEQFYLIFPFILMLTPKRLIMPVLLFFILIANVLRLNPSSWIPAYVLLPCRADAITLGILVALIHYKYTLNSWVKNYSVHLKLGLFFCFFISGLSFILFQDLGSVKHTLIAAIFAIILAFAVSGELVFLKKSLSVPLLVYVGRISYSLYLVHYLILGLVHYVCSGHGYIGISSSYDIGMSFLALLLSLLIAAIIYKYLETPLVALGKNFKY